MRNIGTNIEAVRPRGISALEKTTFEVPGLSQGLRGLAVHSLEVGSQIKNLGLTRSKVHSNRNCRSAATRIAFRNSIVG